MNHSMVSTLVVALTMSACGAGTLPRGAASPDPEPPRAACSAAGLGITVTDPDGLPGPVAATRRAIIGAAVACDFDALADLVDEDFIYSFGGGEDPVGRWRAREADGAEALALIVRLLRLPFTTQQTKDTTYYVWPSAFVWEEADASDIEALRAVFSDADVDLAIEHDQYLLHRVGIDASGSWVFSVSGD